MLRCLVNEKSNMIIQKESNVLRLKTQLECLIEFISP